MRYFTLLLLPYLLFAKPIKIATYNVENLFDASFQGTEYEEYVPGKHNWNRRMMEIKLQHTAEVICDLDADIVGLQEVENTQIFDKLIKVLKRVGCDYRFHAITHKKGAAIQVALLSRYVIKKVRDIQVSFSPRVRNILEVDVSIQGKPLKLFVNHWKSKAYKGYESKRIKYAKALQARIARLSRSKEYIILGDFNSDYNAYLTLDEKNNDTQGKTGFSDILQTKVDENEIQKAQKGVHYSLWRELPVEERWSHKFYGKKSSLDQIVLPQTMFNGKGIDYVNNSFKVFKADYLFTKRGYINRWRYKHGKHMGKGYSDHLPVFAYFDTVPYVPQKVQKHTRRVKNIAYLYSIEKLEGEVVLENAVVIWKRRNNALIKENRIGRGVLLYGCAKKLKIGHRYRLLVDSIKSYKGLKEVNSVYVLKDKGREDIYKYMRSSSELLHGTLKQNEIVTDIAGVYKNRMFYVGESKIPLFFKNRKFQPKNGTKLKIHYAHLGYYNHLQLVIYSKKDFDRVEK